MITRIKQWFCRHEYQAVMTYGLDEELYNVYGIRREVPKSSWDVCKKCSRKQPHVAPKTYVYFTGD